LARYETRLSNINLIYVKQILDILNGLKKVLEKYEKENSTNSHIPPPSSVGRSSIQNLLLSMDLDHINLFKICEYMQNSRISNKLFGFIKKVNTVALANARTIQSQKAKTANVTTRGLETTKINIKKEENSFPAFERFLNAIIGDGDSCVVYGNGTYAWNGNNL
jgi:hypothetical protein